MIPNSRWAFRITFLRNSSRKGLKSSFQSIKTSNSRVMVLKINRKKSILRVYITIRETWPHWEKTSLYVRIKPPTSKIFRSIRVAYWVRALRMSYWVAWGRVWNAYLQVWEISQFRRSYMKLMSLSSLGVLQWTNRLNLVVRK